MNAALLPLLAFASLSASSASPVPVGTAMHWDASADTLDSSWYRFRARRLGGDFQMIRDFGPDPGLDWTPPMREGT